MEGPRKLGRPGLAGTVLKSESCLELAHDIGNNLTNGRGDQVRLLTLFALSFHHMRIHAGVFGGKMV